MKKYIKPELFYERFELTQHIADCAWELNSQNKEVCAALADQAQLSGLPSLFTKPTICEITSDVYNDFCYHGGANGFNVFKS